VHDDQIWYHTVLNAFCCNNNNKPLSLFLSLSFF
jgi:hypothetical protein